VAFVLVTALVALPAIADTADELDSLRQEAARMRQSLDAFDARIRALEAADPSPKPPVANKATMSPYDKQALPPAFSLQRDWSEIKPGTSKERVDELLGKPEREMRINGDQVWYYVYPGVGRGSVFFDGQGKVSSTQAPRAGWSW
jgi:hypothetical protein